VGFVQEINIKGVILDLYCDKLYLN